MKEKKKRKSIIRKYNWFSIEKRDKKTRVI